MHLSSLPLEFDTIKLVKALKHILFNSNWYKIIWLEKICMNMIRIHKSIAKLVTKYTFFVFPFMK